MNQASSTSHRLRQAVVANDITLVERLLKSHPYLLHNPDFSDKSNTSLHLAAKLGHLELAEYLISLGHDHSPEVVDYIYSAAGNNLGISVNTDGQCPLHSAAENHHERMVELLCQQFPKTINRQDKEGRTPLLLAAGTPSTSTKMTSTGKVTVQNNDSVEAIETLLKFGADPQSIDYDGNTCLHNACAWGNLKAIRALIHAGTDPVKANHAGWTPNAYSLTVQADVYYKNLVLEFDRQKAEAYAREAARAAEKKNAAGSRVRMVPQDDEEGDSDYTTGDEENLDATKDDRRRTVISTSADGGLGIDLRRNRV